MAAPALHLRNKVRGLNRLREILAVLVIHGFEEALAELGLLKAFGPLKRRAASSSPEVSRAARFRQALEALGPTFIKLGQVLSTRPDLIPSNWADELKRLQDDCQHLDFAVIEQRLEEEFPAGVDELFTSIEEQPVAAASLAQVHRAVLADGNHVVLKVLRPGVRRIIEADMEALASLARFVEAHFKDLGYSPLEVVDEFSNELHNELDLTHEARATERLARDFADDPFVSFPQVFWQATTRSVLALEEIKGQLLSRMAHHDLSPRQKRTIVERGADAVFKQCLELGFFHADPHPGNIFILPAEKICFIDCGMTGRIDRGTSDQLADLVAAVAAEDLEAVVRAAIKLAAADPALAIDRTFRLDVAALVSSLHDSTLEQMDLGALLDGLFELFRKYRVRCPSDLIFLIKAITTIIAVGREVDPTFDLVAHVRPHIDRLVMRRYGPRAMAERLLGSLTEFATLAEDLPTEIRVFLDRVRRNNLVVRLEHQRLDRLTDTVEHASRNIAGSLVVAALMVGSAILVLADRFASGDGLLSTFGLVGWVVAGLLAVLQVIASSRYLSKKRDAD